MQSLSSDSGIPSISELPGHMTVRFESGVRTRGNVKTLLMDMKVRKSETEPSQSLTVN